MSILSEPSASKPGEQASSGATSGRTRSVAHDSANETAANSEVTDAVNTEILPSNDEIATQAADPSTISEGAEIDAPLPSVSATSANTNATIFASATVDRNITEKQQQLYQLCNHPYIDGGDLIQAATLIVHSILDILNVDRVRFWERSDAQNFQLLTGAAVNETVTPCPKSSLNVKDYPGYFDRLRERTGLRLNEISTPNPTVRQLIANDCLFHQPGALLEIPVHAVGELRGIIWLERRDAYRWTHLDEASAMTIALLASRILSASQQQRTLDELTLHRRKLKRETIEREQAERAWQESQRFIQGIIDASTNILYVDSFEDGRNVYMNRCVESVLGYTPQDIVKMGPRYLEELVHADHKAQMARERRKLAAINDGEVVESEYQFRHRQGNWRWLLCRETVFQRGADGQPTQIFGTATDITKHKHAENTLREFNAELERLARMDGLTQVANRRSFDEYLQQEWKNLGSGRSSLSLILCDIDYFKSFNDTYGHQAGDVCLRKVAKAIEQAVKRSTDLVARYGGEEFGIILPNTSAEGVKQVAREIQKAIWSLEIPHSQSEVGDVITLSLGLASISSHENAHPDMLVAAADQGLYQSKYHGRNRFCTGELEQI